MNRNDLRGKKDGYWLQYLDSNANPTDKQNYKYLGLEYYENGKVLFRFKKFHWKNKALLTVERDTCCSHDKICGVFRWFDAKTKQLFAEEKYYCGNPVYFKEYHYYTRNDSSICGFTETADYSRKFENQIGSFYYEKWFDTTQYVGPTRKCYWFRKVKNKWKLQRIRDNNYST